MKSAFALSRSNQPRCAVRCARPPACGAHRFAVGVVGRRNLRHGGLCKGEAQRVRLDGALGLTAAVGERRARRYDDASAPLRAG